MFTIKTKCPKCKAEIKGIKGLTSSIRCGKCGEFIDLEKSFPHHFLPKGREKNIDPKNII